MRRLVATRSKAEGSSGFRSLLSQKMKCAHTEWRRTFANKKIVWKFLELFRKEDRSWSFSKVSVSVRLDLNSIFVSLPILLSTPTTTTTTTFDCIGFASNPGKPKNYETLKRAQKKLCVDKNSILKCSQKRGDVKKTFQFFPDWKNSGKNIFDDLVFLEKPLDDGSEDEARLGSLEGHGHVLAGSDRPPEQVLGPSGRIWTVRKELLSNLSVSVWVWV